MPDEEWRSIAGLPLYEVSSWGRVRSHHPRWLSPKSTTGGKPRILSQYLTTGHPRVSLVTDEGPREMLVRVLMARAFFGAESAVNVDGNTRNNMLSNLEPTSGMAESVSIRRPATLTAEQVTRLVDDARDPAASLVSESLVRQIRRGAKWRTVTAGMTLAAERRRVRDAEIASSTDSTRVLAARHGLSETGVRLIRRRHASRR